MDNNYDVVVIGGGAAGLSGAVALARSRRAVLVIDAGDPRNAPAGHVHNFLTRDHTPPAELYAAGQAELRKYGGKIETGQVTALHQLEDGFGVEIGDSTITARRLLVATGLRDELPDIPGLADRWGIDVLHCPYCHGWEVRDQRIGILSTGPMSMHQALLFRQLSPSITFLQHTGPALTDEQREQLDALEITFVTGEVVHVGAADSGLTGVTLADGGQVSLDALVVAPRFRARADLLAPLGLTPVELVVDGQVIADHIEADPTGATAVPGLWVAGNISDVQAQVISAAAAGLSAGARINADLARADARAAVEVYRHGRIHGEAAWDERYRERPQTWSGQPNLALVAEATGLAPGTVLEAGAGEGGDAIWLAQQGWKVTAAELSSVALGRAQARAEHLGVSIDWLHLDLTKAAPPATYDLVTAFYLHMPATARTALWRHLGAAVAPGGTLLVVGHDRDDMKAATHRAHLDDMGWTLEEIVTALGSGWTIEVAESRPRPHVDHDGNDATINDAILRARRTP
jgi:thioredoxin reductase